MYHSYKATPLSTAKFLNEKCDVPKSSVRRLVRIDCPVYGLPVMMTERDEEPFEVIEKAIMDLMYHSGINQRQILFNSMGISAYSDMGNEVIDYLMSTGQIDEQDGILSISGLGKESLHSEVKILQRTSSRMLYFDALSLLPLPAKYYDVKNVEFVKPGNDSCKNANLIDFWEQFPEQAITEVLRYPGEKRYAYNIPQELENLWIDHAKVSILTSKTSMAGLVQYIPLYLVIVSDTVTDFIKSMGIFEWNKQMIFDGKNIRVYNAFSGEHDPFFQGIFEHNIEKISPQLTNVLRKKFIEDSANEDFSSDKRVQPEIFKLPIFKILKNPEQYIVADGNFEFMWTKADVLPFISEFNRVQLSQLKKGWYQPVQDPLHRGRIARIDIDSELQTFIEEEIKRRIRKDPAMEEKSVAYVEKAIEKALS